MNDTLDEQSRLALVRYRLERADETMEEARIMAENGHYNAASTVCTMLASMPRRPCC